MKRRKVFNLVISALLLAGLFYTANWRRILSQIVKADLLLYFSALSLFLTTYMFHGWRWKNLAKISGLNLSLKNSIKIIAVSYGFNTIFPGNAGDLVRSKIVEKFHELETHGSILGLVALERFLDACAVVSIVVFSAFFVKAEVFTSISWILTPFLIGIILFTVFLNYSYSLSTEILPEKIREELSEFSQTLDSFNRYELTENFLIGLAAWIIEAAVFYILSISLGLELGLAGAALVTSVISLLSSLPISPGGLGIADVTAAGLLVLLGLNYSDSVSLIVLQRSIGLGVIGVTGGLVYWGHELTS